MIPKTATVLVVGAGPSGLAALKELREAGIEAVAVDQRSDFGGVFAPSSGVTFEKLYLTTSNMFMAFSDFPPADTKIKYWSQREYYEYLVSYVDHFQLTPHIYLKTSIKHAKLDTYGDWQVKLATAEKEECSLIFDYLVVATGANHKPRMPKLFEGFQGEIIHSQQYHSAKQVQGKNVLVVGIGESSADVVVSASKTARRVTAWSRHMPNVAPRFTSELLKDKNYDEAEILASQDKHNRTPADFLDLLTTSRVMRNFPLGIWATVLQKGLCEDVKRAHGSKSAAGLMGDWCMNLWAPDFFSGDHSSVPTKSVMMCTVAAQQKMDLAVAPRIHCQGKKVVFEDPIYYGIDKTETRDEISIDVDVIVACTGYDISFDWLEAPGLEANPRFWFKHAFPTQGNLGEKLAFLGYARPHQGGIPQCSEMVARYVAQLLAKKIALPANYKEMALAEGVCEEQCYHMSEHVLVLVDYSAFMLSLSRLIGCEPAVPINPLNPSAMIKYWFFPLWSCFFRTAGVGAKPETCDAVLDKFGTFDGLAPDLSLTAVQLFLTFFTPFLNALFYITNLIYWCCDGRPAKGMWWGFKWRSSKAHLMCGHTLRLKDLLLPIMVQYVAGYVVIGYGVLCLLGLGSLVVNHGMPSVDKKVTKKAV